MKIFHSFNILKSFILFILLNFSYEQMKYFPETYKENDLLIPENDKESQYQYNLVEAKVLTKQLITLYIKKQGIPLDRDDCCEGFTTFDAWKNRNMETDSDFEEIFNNTIYNPSENILTYKFPVPRIENPGFTLFHKVWVFDKDGANNCNIYFNNGQEDSAKITFNLPGGKNFVNLEITFNKTGSEENTVTFNNGQEITLDSSFEISTINYEFVGPSYSPAIALHWTYYKIQKGTDNFSLKGKGICSYKNPCIKGYTCAGGLCEKCHASCFDCKNGGLTTDCDSKCSTHSTRITPDRGSCPLAYVDLSNFDSFTLVDLVPPTRNNRITISFWFFLSSFPENEIISGPFDNRQEKIKNYQPRVRLSNPYCDAVNFTFFFTNSDLTIDCGGIESAPLTELNTWYFVKCANSGDHNRHTFFIKYFTIGGFEYQYFNKIERESSGGGSHKEGRVYFEPEDYITFYFQGFNELYNNDIPFHFYMKQFVIFREYVQEPYDNKYFNFEKIFTSTFELPEVMFIIPFDELIRNDNKYDVKCYSYSGSILENRITLTPYYYMKNYTLFPPKLFKRLNLLDRNQKYTSPDLINIEDVLRDNNTLIASYDYSPITCIDNHFLTYEMKLFSPPGNYLGICTYDCEDGYSSFPGLDEKKGFCNKKCSNSNDSSICSSNNYDLLHRRSNFQCRSGYFEIFDNCDKRDINIEKNNVFLYNHDQGPANIVMDVIDYNLKSYIIEFWIYLSYCSVEPDGRYILFYTNQFDITYIYYSPFSYDVTFKTKANRIEKYISNEIKFSKWNHIVVEVYYDPKAAYDRKSIIYKQIKLDSENPEEMDHSENVLPLNYIYFCNGRKASCQNIDMTWYCAYYKNLRLFNSFLSSRHVIYRYDEYYWDYKYLLSSIFLYYPLYGHYIANNLLSQYNSKDSALNTNSPTNNWNFPQYSYNTVIVKNNSCPDNCTECFYSTEDGERARCYQCENNYHLFKSYLDKKINKNYISCINDSESEYVLKLPSNANFKMTPLKGLKEAGVTVNFFIKIYGFTIRDKIDIIYLGDHLKINYNSNIDSPYFGLNLVTFKDSSETVISNYYHFRKHFGIWTFISVSSYDQTYENFFPPMIRFEINDKKMPIIGPLENIAIGTIYFSDELFALVQRVKVYNTYLIGTISIETHENTFIDNIDKNNYIVSNNNEYASYFIPMKSKSDCLFSKFNLIGTDKVNEELIIPNYECVVDDIREILSDRKFMDLNWTYTYSFKSEVESFAKSCKPEITECDLCFNDTKESCSCNFINKEQKIFLGNVSNHYCKKLKLVNFAKIANIETNNGILMNETKVPNIKIGGEEFTLHFWVFAYSYVDKVFQGFTIEWKGYTTIRVGIDPSNNYYFTCLINGAETNEFMEFNMNHWNFLHCAIDYTNSKFYIASENKVNDFGFTYTNSPKEKEKLQNTTSLIIKDLTNVKDWGYLFFRHIRLWKEALKHSSFLSRINIVDNYFDTKRDEEGTLLHQWDSLFNSDHLIKSTTQESKYSFKIKYSSEKIGTNIVPEEIYQEVLDEPYLCDDDGQFYDRKTKKCINFTDTSNIIDNIYIDNIDVAYSHNYGIAFWIFLEDHKDIIKPINIIWQYHMQISLQYVGSTFKAYCFPQNYEPYSKIIQNSDSLDEKTQKILNSATNEYTGDLKGEWLWFQCSLSYNNRFFYLNENTQKLIIETLYKEGNTEFKNDEPLGYFYNKMSASLSSLKVEITGNRDRENGAHKNIYLRCLYLFKDFLPYNYNFKYMDLFKIKENEFPPLVFAMNFAEFDFEKKSQGFFQVKYNKFRSRDNTIFREINGVQTNSTIYFKNTTKLALSKNFAFLPLCNPITKEKYNPETELCKEITDCDYTALNALYCMEEKTPLICKKNYYINIDPISNSAFCSNYCEDPNFFRSPGTTEDKGICGTNCLSVDVLKTCPNSASSILAYQEKFECNPGYNRIGYQCILEPTRNSPNEGALFYSGVNNPYNIHHNFTNNTLINEFDKNYVLEFWFMIDNVIYKRKDFKQNEKYYYFLSDPHELYLIKEAAKKYNYFYNYNENNEIKITELIHQYEWNKILIFVDKDKKLITIYINFDKANKKTLSISEALNLKFIAFCSNTEVYYREFKSPICPTRNNKKINWASAYYNNIRVWNLKISTIDTIQSFINKIYLEYPHSLVLFYPLKIKYLDNNQMTNLMYNYGEHITLACKNANVCSIYNKDNIIIYNYSTKFDWGLLHSKQFVSMMGEEVEEGEEESDGLAINPNDERNNCNEHCVRCYDTDNIKQCYECETGYVLQYKECKDARKLYFLKTPSGTVGASVNLKTKNKLLEDYCNLPSFTIVFWMKFFGIKYHPTSDFNKILSIDANTYLSYQNTTNYLVFRENSKNVFIDYRFREYFGIWIPIAIANYISNSISDVYPNMLTLSVNRRDIPFVENYNLPASGIKATELSFGSEIIALFAELSIYSKFIHGAYGRIRSEQVLTDQFYYKSLTGTKPNDCLVVEDDLLSPIDLICAPDYSVNFIDSYYCKDDTKYYNPYDENNDEKPDGEKCGNCNNECITLCYGATEQNCTCDMTEGIFWLRKVGKKNSLNQTYCEHIYYLDFSNINPYTYYNTPITKTQEYTIDFWLFIYPYNTKAINFKELYLEWNFHNRIRLYEENLALKVDCQPIWRSIDFSTTIYSDVRTSSFQFPKWNYIRCGTDLKNRKYFSNSNIEYPLKAKKENFFNYKEIETYTSGLKFFKIYRSEDFKNNFGIVFIREIKLWQQYNLDYLDSQRVFFDMNEITKEQIKKNFPGLLLYYKNLYNQTKEGNSVIKEELTAKTTIVAKSPDYLGYNIVDPNPDAEQYMIRLEEICPVGHVYDTNLYKCVCAEGFDEISGNCVPVGNELDATCEIYSNIYKQCFQCKENNQYLNKWVEEFGEECYSECPPTLYEDPLINQCRRCHETCYECTGEFYNNCTSCTGILYFNFKENTCIPNCQAAELTRSLTKPNICVYFDCEAVLVNVGEEIPINIHTFDYIEAEIIQPTSSEYGTLWLFDVEKTNSINRELGFEDDLDINASPFIGDKSKIITPLDHNFFITEHKYVFGLKVFAENKGLEVALYFWWTLTMNAPPYGGKLTVMPYLGLFNTTTFIMRCVDYEDENTPTEDLEYEFYYIEVNTNYKVKLTNEFSLNNEVYSNFTVRYYQLEYSNITLYCQVRDKWGAISETSNMITIVNKKNSPLYILKQLVASFYIVDDALTDIQLLARSEVLMSLGINPYTDRVPSSFFTTYEGSLTGEKVLILEPQCVNGYCNDNGDCEVIDVALTCKCTASYLGKQCFLDKNGYSDLSDYYLKMYLRLQDRVNGVAAEPFNDIIFQAFYKLFFAAQNFFQNDTFFQNNLIEFKTYLKTEYNYITANVDRFNKILDLDDFFFNYFYVKETQIKLTTKINEGYPFRNKTLTDEDSPSYAIAIYTFFQMLDEDTVFIIQNYGYDYNYKCQHFVYELIKIDETFNDAEYFESLKTPLITYKPTILFMNCLRQKYSTFNFYLNYIEFLVNPMSYDSTFYPNITSPLISIKLYDLSGNEVVINNCASPIKINMPFNAYDWIDYINKQKWLFLPENYKLEDDPIFRDPILIWENGSVSDDTVEQRIAKYYRYYNIVGLVYTPNSPSLFEYTSFLFKNISDTFFLLFETNHLSLFSSMIIPNIMNFVVDGRFFYVPRYMVLVYYPNQLSNPVFYLIISFLIIFAIICFIFLNKDQLYFDNLEDLQILKREIIKAKNDYNQFNLGLNDENIIRNLPQKDARLKKNESKKIRTMFDEYDVDGIQEIEEDEKEEENENNLKNILKTGSNNLHTLNTNEDRGYSNTGRKFVSRYETKDIEENKDEEEIEKATGIFTHKRKKKERGINNRNKKKDNPPKRRNDDDEDQEYNLQKTISKKKITLDLDKSKNDRYKRNKKEEKKSDDGYGNGDDDEDFDEKRIEKMSSEKSSIKYGGFRGTKQNFDLKTLNSLNEKLGYNITKYSKFSKFSKLSSQSKKSYFLDKEKTKANLISLNKFHDHSKKVNIDKNLESREEESKKILEEYTRLSLTPFEFFKFNLRTRHILVAPFLNLTLYHNRWKKLIVLLTQFYIQQLALSIILTSDEKIIIPNFTGMILASLIAGAISNIIIYCFVFLFETDFYERIKLYRLVMAGEDLYIFKAWSSLQKKMNTKLIFGIIICVAFWIPNLYISLIFTAVWKVQRIPWIICVFFTLFLDLVVGEICVEGICAFFYRYRLTFNLIRNLGNLLNNLRRYRTMYP